MGESMSDQNSQEGFEINYSSLILGFSSAALSYLGYMKETPDGSGMNLKLAKQNIDIIALLKDKTSGNLSDEEQRLTEAVLADLRLKYVEKAKTATKTN